MAPPSDHEVTKNIVRLPKRILAPPFSQYHSVQKLCEWSKLNKHFLCIPQVGLWLFHIFEEKKTRQVLNMKK